MKYSEYTNIMRKITNVTTLTTTEKDYIKTSLYTLVDNSTDIEPINTSKYTYKVNSSGVKKYVLVLYYSNQNFEKIDSVFDALVSNYSDLFFNYRKVKVSDNLEADNTSKYVYLNPTEFNRVTELNLLAGSNGNSGYFFKPNDYLKKIELMALEKVGLDNFLNSYLQSPSIDITVANFDVQSYMDITVLASDDKAYLTKNNIIKYIDSAQSENKIIEEVINHLINRRVIIRQQIGMVY